MDWKANVDFSQQKIESKIAEIRNNLPPETQITVEKMNPSILPVIGYTLESHNRSPIELKQLALYTIKPFLSQVAGVSEVRVIGGKVKEYWLELDPRKNEFTDDYSRQYKLRNCHKQILSDPMVICLIIAFYI